MIELTKGRNFNLVLIVDFFDGDNFTTHPGFVDDTLSAGC
jgi:hypothetical protein